MKPGNTKTKVAGGSCLGGFVGAISAACVAAAVVEIVGGDPPKIEAGFAFIGFVAWLSVFVGSVFIAGVLGAIAGSVTGAILATQSAKKDVTSQPVIETAALADTPPQSAEQEIARLKERIAELEQKQ